MKRTIYVVGYLFSGLVGFLIGVIFGFILLRVLYWLWGAGSLSWIEVSWWVVLLVVGGLVGGLYGGYRFLVAHGRYYWLSGMKREHRMVFYGLRGVFQIPESVMRDIIWAYSYTVVESIVPMMVLCIAMVFFTALLFPFLWYFSLLAAFILGLFVMGIVQHITTKLFFPENIANELKQVDKIWGVYAERERERKLASERKPRRERVRRVK